MRGIALALALAAVLPAGPAWAQEPSQTEILPLPPRAGSCYAHSDTAPEGCLCMNEDVIIDAAAELRVHRKEGALPVSWFERVVWITLTALGVWLL